ncbi:putative ABC transporter A, ABCA [Lupinus albus]|uniref:Putative ABC transporter A, ABCA n=1 Tax=Lupinus albus TaxID=3870 RepID=A0A6A4PKA7_LUPAL|nr:putative ABC transporter A, ABCA [Lupinus albus]
MANPAPASFWAQANALFRKNLTYQKRNVKTNIRLILFPVLLCVILVVLQRIVDRVQSKDDGNICVKNSSKKEGDANWYATGDISKVPVCAVPNPPQWPPFLQLPNPLFSAVQTNILPFSDLPNHKCRARVECPLTMLFTASNFSFAQCK